MYTLLFIINRVSVGGAERLLIDELHELHRRGIKAHVITLYPEGRTSLLKELAIPSEYIHLISVPHLLSISGWARLVRCIQRIQPNAVVCHLWYANSVGRIAAAFAGVKNVTVFEHNVYDRVKTPKQFLIDRILQRWARRIVAVSDEVKDSLLRHGIARRRVVVLPNAINVSRYTNVLPADMREAYGLPADSFVLLAIGRLTRQKGFDVLLRALALLPETIYAVVLGAGEEEAALRALAEDLGVESQVRFGGIRHDIPAVLKGSDCLVMPSRWEGEPIVLLEALAAGVPVAGSAIPPLKKVIKEGENGILVPVDDVTLLAEAIKKIAEGKVKEGIPLLPANRTIVHHIDELLSLIQ